MSTPTTKCTLVDFIIGLRAGAIFASTVFLGLFGVTVVLFISLVASIFASTVFLGLVQP
jgi:hypothetical protein